jgi:acetoin utilization protein AcuB
MLAEASTQAKQDPPAAVQNQRVGDVMRRDFITISREESLLEALQLMRLARLRHLAVVSDGVLVGVLSYRDLQDELVASLDLASPASSAAAIGEIGVEERMQGTPFSIVPDATLAEAAARLDRLRVGCLPVVEPGEQGLRLVGLLTEMDLLRAAFAI